MNQPTFSRCDDSQVEAREAVPTGYRAGVVGLGWMGLLSDLGKRPPDRYEIDDVERPTPELDVHRRFHFHEGSGTVEVPHSWAEVIWQRPEVELVAAAERDVRRLAVFRERYGIDAVYEDAESMLRDQDLDIVAIATNTAGRATLTCLAAECGVRAIAVEKPLAHTLAEADRMVETCARANVPLLAGAVPMNHPSYAVAQELVNSGAIGEPLAVEADSPHAQKPHWSLFIDEPLAWVVGTGDRPRRESGSDEFAGQGMVTTDNELVIFFRPGAGLARVTGSTGALALDNGWRLWQDMEGDSRYRREVAWTGTQFAGGYNAVFGLSELIDCLDGRSSEPRSSGRRVAMALEVEIALKLSASRGGERTDLPLADRSLGLNYDWFR